MESTRKDLLKLAGCVLASIVATVGVMYTGVVPQPAPKPTPVQVVIKDRDISGPVGPIEAGRLAKFSLPAGVTDVKGHWKAVSRSTTVPDPNVEEADNGLTAFVESFHPCTYYISVAGLKDGKVFHWATTQDVTGKQPIPPPVDPVDPKPVDPKPVEPIFDRVSQIAFVYESEMGAPTAFFTEELEGYLSAKSIPYYRADKNVQFADPDVGNKWKPLLSAASDVPCVVVSRGGKLEFKKVDGEDVAGVFAYVKGQVGQ